MGQLLGLTTIPKQYLLDGWGRPLRYRALSRDHYRIISGGPDRRVGNRDDLVMEDGRLVQGPRDLLGFGDF